MLLAVVALASSGRSRSGEGRGVVVLAVDVEPRLRVELAQVVLGFGQHAAGAAGRVESLRTVPGVVSSSSSWMNRRFTISRMTSRGVKWSPAVSLASSLKRRMRFSKM